MRAKTMILLGMALLLAACASHRDNYSHSILDKRQARIVDKTIAAIAENNTLPRMDDVWGSTYETTESQLLNRLLAIEDLDSLARNHPSPAVRATAGIILIERAPNAAKRLLAEQLTDSSTLITRSYGFCVVSRSGNAVGNILLSYAIDNGLFSQKELRAIDSAILVNPACRHLSRYHHLTGTPVPRKAFLDMMNNRPHRSPSFHHDLLTDNRLVSDTTLFYRQISQLLHLDTTPRLYLLDAFMRDQWKGYTVSQVYLADGCDRLALLLIDGKYDIVDTLTISKPIRVQPLSATDTLYTRTYFVLGPTPVMLRKEIMLRTADGIVDTLENRDVVHGYSVEPGRGFVDRRRTQTVDLLRKTNTIHEEPACDHR